MTVRYGSLPFAEQIRFLRRKTSLPTAGWTDIWEAEHDYAFVVAGANRDDVLRSLRAAVERAISEGRPLADFRREFDSIIESTGWQYRGGRNWRTRVIYDTNMRTSYAAGRYEQLREESESRPYWRYRHSDATNPRLQHQSWDGLVLRWDDPWWDAHYPPGGWGCGCTVESLAERDLRRLNLRVGEAPAVRMVQVTVGQRSTIGPRTVLVPEGIDPGFGYIPGRARLASQVPPSLPPTAPAGSRMLPTRTPDDPLPDAAERAERLGDRLTPLEYSATFLRRFNAESGAVHRDVLGERLAIGPEMWRDPQGRPSIAPDLRPYMLALAAAIEAPGEIWTRLEWIAQVEQAVVARIYIARIRVGGREVTAIMERRSDGWRATIDQDGTATAAARAGVRLYRKPD